MKFRCKIIINLLSPKKQTVRANAFSVEIQKQIFSETGYYTSAVLFVGKPIHIIQLSDELIRVSVDNGIQCTRISVEVT